VLRSYGDSRLFGESYGEGPVRVVWLHGWAREARDFVVAAQLLADQGVASVALDLPGFGSSPAPDRAGGARYYAELIAPTLHEIADGPLILVGHSFGGRIAVVLASKYPGLVEELVLTGVPQLVRLRASRRSPLTYRVIRALARRHLLSAARLEGARQKYGSSDYRHAQGVIRDVLVATVQETYESELASLTLPIAFVWGEADRDVPVEIATRAAALVQGPATIDVVSGVGHLLPLEAPDALVTATEKALRR
jgi:pimeloyl-ACP methyl ester carboxylesterase